VENGIFTVDEPQPPRRDIIRHLGRTICFGVLIPWLMSGFMRFRPWFFFGCLAAFVGSRFAFRKLKALVEVEWSWRDWVWAGLAVVITIAYAFGLTPHGLARLIRM
jgi:hypothetical protein